MNLEKRLQLFREKVGGNSANVVDQLIQKNGSKDLCVFCGSKQDLTKEHVVPQWTFESRPDKHFVTSINGISQKYIKTVVPCCRECNSYILGFLERDIKKSFKTTDLETSFFSRREEDNIILWLEIIDYKFQVLNLRRKFLKHKEGDFVPFLSDIPLALMQDRASVSPSEVRDNVLSSSRRISNKSKESKRNSLLVFKTKNPDFHFFHEMNDFIFLELPRFGIAVFLFLGKEFGKHDKGHEEARKIISKVY